MAYLPGGYSSDDSDFSDREMIRGYPNGASSTQTPPAQSSDSQNTRWLKKAASDFSPSGPHSEAEVNLKLAVEAGDVQLFNKYRSEVVNSGMEPDWSPAYLAASKGCIRLLEHILENGGKAGVKGAEMTGLLALAGAESLEEREECSLLAVCQMLIKTGENIDAYQRQRKTALMLAAEGGHGGLVKVLCQLGANLDCVDTQGWTALMFAADRAQGAIARTLLDAGANTDIVNCDGRTAADMAADRNCPTLQKLVEHFSRTPGIRLAAADAKEAKPRRYSELETILLGLDLQEYIPTFSQHHIALPEFLLLTDRELKEMGVEKVGARKKLLEGQAAIHKTQWERSSMPHLSYDDRKTGLRLSCPEAMAVMGNMEQHLRLLKASVAYVRLQLREGSGRMLEVGGDVVTPAQLILQVESCGDKVSKLIQEIKYLHKELERAGARSKESSADSQVKKRSQWNTYAVNLSLAVFACAVLSFVAFRR